MLVPVFENSHPSSAVVSLDPSVDSMAVGKASGRTLRFIRQ